MFTATLIYAGLLPLAASAVMTLALSRSRVSPQATWACGTAFGFVIGQFGLKSQSAGFAAAARSFVQPHEGVDWLPLIVVLALGLSILLMSSQQRPRWRRTVALATVLAIAVPLRLLSGNVRLAGQWSAVEKLAYLTLLAATLGLIWLLLASRGDKEQSPVRLLFVVVVAVGTAVVLTLSGVLVYGQTCGAVAAALVGTAIAGFSGATGTASASRRRLPPGFNSAAGIITFTLGSLIILGRFYAELSALNAAMLFVSLAAAGAPCPNVVQHVPAWQQLAVRTVLCLTPLTIAIARAAR